MQESGKNTRLHIQEETKVLINRNNNDQKDKSRRLEKEKTDSRRNTVARVGQQRTSMLGLNMNGVSTNNNAQSLLPLTPNTTTTGKNVTDLVLGLVQ